MQRKTTTEIGPSRLPGRPFLYTLDQIASLCQVTESTVKSWCHFEGRTSGVKSPDRMLAQNIAPDDLKPEWRVDENEFKRYLKRKGIRFYEYKSSTR